MNKSVAKIPVNLNPNMQGLTTSATLAINEKSNALISAGKKVFKLGLGQSPFPVEASVVSSLQQHAHEKDYLPVKGLKPLREAISTYYNKKSFCQSTAEDVIIGPGSKELLFLLQFVYSGDLLIPEPSWVSYEPQARIIGSSVHWLKTSYEKRWLLTPDEIDRQCAEAPDRPRILILNYPSNPTGQTFRSDELQALAGACRKHGVLVLSDEIYAELTFDDKHESIAKYYPEGTIISGGLSKWCGAGGWRLGCFVFPEGLRWLSDAIAVVASETYTSVSAPIQYAAITAFKGGPQIETYLQNSRAILTVLGGKVAQILQQKNVKVHAPDGAFYLFPDFSEYAAQFKKAGISTSEKMCEKLLSDTGVAILPGSCFGRPSEEFSARLAYVNFDGTGALNAAAKETVDDDFLAKYCADTLAAFEKIASWLGSF